MVAHQLQRNDAGVAEPARAVVSRTVHGALHPFTLSAPGVSNPRRGLNGPYISRPSLYKYDAVSFPHRTTTWRSLFVDRTEGRGNSYEGPGVPAQRVVRLRSRPPCHDGR